MFAMYRYTIMCIIYVGLMIFVYFLFCDHNMVTHKKRGCRGRDRMVFGNTNTCAIGTYKLLVQTPFMVRCARYSRARVAR